jgi:hypothetical protein
MSIFFTLPHQPLGKALPPGASHTCNQDDHAFGWVQITICRTDMFVLKKIIWVLEDRDQSNLRIGIEALSKRSQRSPTHDFKAMNSCLFRNGIPVTQPGKEQENGCFYRD